MGRIQKFMLLLNYHWSASGGRYPNTDSPLVVIEDTCLLFAVILKAKVFSSAWLKDVQNFCKKC